MTVTASTGVTPVLASTRHKAQKIARLIRWNKRSLWTARKECCPIYRGVYVHGARLALLLIRPFEIE